MKDLGYIQRRKQTTKNEKSRIKQKTEGKKEHGANETNLKTVNNRFKTPVYQ